MTSRLAVTDDVTGQVKVKIFDIWSMFTLWALTVAKSDWAQIWSPHFEIHIERTLGVSRMYLHGIFEVKARSQEVTEIFK